MPRRKRVSKRRGLSPVERAWAALEEGLPPNPLVRRGVDAAGGVPVDLDDAELLSFDDLDGDESRHGATPRDDHDRS